MKLYEIFPSKAKHKKYAVFVMKDGKKKKIHFGDKRYQQFKDSTRLKKYSNLDHGDKERRKRYLARAKKIKNKKGQLTAKLKSSPNYWAIKFLW